jgi:hypothetical protein
MQFGSKLKLLALTALMMVVPASAVNMSASRDAAMTGAFRLVSLGLETIVPANATMYYNFLAIGVLFLLGALSSSRNTRFFAVLIPVFAALFVYFEWLRGPDPVQTWGVIVVCIILGSAIYMKDSLRERFGVGGPGSMIVNLMIFMILLQTVIGVVNMTNIWEGNAAPTPENEWKYDNVKLETQIPIVTNSGGLLGSIASTLGVMTDMMISSLKLMLTLLLSLVAFSGVLGLTYPWMVWNLDGTANIYGLAVLGLIQVGIYILYTKFIFELYYKPTMGSVDF